jgi:hypothetical protein
VPTPEILGRHPQKYAIDPYQQFAYTTGKNASDIALVIDAMDLLHSGRFEGFCLVSSDSDFTRLASRLREQGADVFGFGEQKTPESFRQACRKFIYTENLLPGAQVSTTEEGGFRQSPATAQRGYSHLEQGHDSNRDGRWLGRFGRSGATPREHRFRFRPAHLWNRKSSDLVRKTGAFDIDHRRAEQCGLGRNRSNHPRLASQRQPPGKATFAHQPLRG